MVLMPVKQYCSYNCYCCSFIYFAHKPVVMGEHRSNAERSYNIVHDEFSSVAKIQAGKQCKGISLAKNLAVDFNTRNISEVYNRFQGHSPLFVQLERSVICKR